MGFSAFSVVRVSADTGGDRCQRKSVRRLGFQLGTVSGFSRLKVSALTKADFAPFPLAEGGSFRLREVFRSHHLPGCIVLPPLARSIADGPLCPFFRFAQLHSHVILGATK